MSKAEVGGGGGGGGGGVGVGDGGVGGGGVGGGGGGGGGEGNGEGSRKLKGMALDAIYGRRSRRRGGGVKKWGGKTRRGERETGKRNE